MSGNTHVSERLKSCRENLHISQVLLAELAGINPTQLYRYESGKTKLLMDAAEKIAAALGVSTARLVHGTLPSARGTQTDLPVPAGGALNLNFLELPPRACLRREAPVHTKWQHRRNRAAEPRASRPRSHAQKSLGLRRVRKQEREITGSLPC
ncbi:hypothetical protein CSQ93_05410 [Janthinobacterium sp. BJB426]|nr:hypothetical protein CSQ93_05410 [Janthinobacterium sp. BJB426]